MRWAKCLAVGLFLALYFVSIASSQRTLAYKQARKCDYCTEDIHPVCVNGITFQNPCLAGCQSDQVGIEGACQGDDLFPLPHWGSGAAAGGAAPTAGTTTPQTVISPSVKSAGKQFTKEATTRASRNIMRQRSRAADMERFGSDGFVFVGSLDLHTAPARKVDPTVLNGRLRASPGDSVRTAGAAANNADASLDGLQVRAMRYAVDTGDFFMEANPRPARQRVSKRVLLASEELSSSGVAMGWTAGSSNGRCNTSCSSSSGVGKAAAGGEGRDALGAGSGSADGQGVVGGLPGRRRLLTDSRWRVLDHTVYPFNAIALISFSPMLMGGRIQCSGAFISPMDVLTAAHCVWDFANNTGYTGWRVYPGLVLDTPLLATTPFIAADYVTFYRTESRNSSYATQRSSVNYFDIAIIRVRTPHMAWLGMKYNCARSSYPKTLACGYTDQVTFQQCSQCYLTTSQCRPMWQMYNYCFSRRGQSGMPIMDLNDTRVLGVLSGGPNWTWDYSYWTPIDAFHFNNLMLWMWNSDTIVRAAGVGKSPKPARPPPPRMMPPPPPVPGLIRNPVRPLPPPLTISMQASPLPFARAPPLRPPPGRLSPPPASKGSSQSSGRSGLVAVPYLDSTYANTQPAVPGVYGPVLPYSMPTYMPPAAAALPPQLPTTRTTAVDERPQQLSISSGEAGFDSGWVSPSPVVSEWVSSSDGAVHQEESGSGLESRSSTLSGNSPGVAMPYIASATSSQSTVACRNGTLRLADGPNSWSGRVEICANGVWGTICDLGWGWDDARVACRQLGFPAGGEAISGGWFPSAAASMPIYMGNLTCLGFETSLMDCFQPGPAGNCTHPFDAGVICTNPTVASPPPAWGFTNGSNTWQPVDYPCSQEGMLRLVPSYGTIMTSNRSTPAVGLGRGRVEVCSSGQWGSVCDDAWDNNDAAVVCRQMKFTGGWALTRTTKTAAPQSPPNSSFLAASLTLLSPGPLNMSIWLSNVDCSGTESSLLACRRRSALGQAACTHQEDAGVVCFSSAAPAAPPQPPPPECSEDGALRLVPLPGQPQGTGRLEVCYDGRYGLVCDTNFGVSEARVACRQLNYLYGRPMGPSNSGVAGDPGPGAFFWMEDVKCSIAGSDGGSWFWRLTQCTFSDWGGSRCTPQRQAVGLVCSNDAAVIAPSPPSPPPSSSPYRCSTPGSIRVNGGNSSFGRLEVCSSSNAWGTVCDSGWGNTDAAVACRELGFTSGAAAAPGSFPVGSGDQALVLSDVACTGSEPRLWSCSSRSAAAAGCSDHRRDVGLACSNPTQPNRLNVTCSEIGALRIVSSSGAVQTSLPAVGRVEVCYNNEWGALCNLYEDAPNSWDDINAAVVCTQLNGGVTVSEALPLSPADSRVPPLPAAMRFWRYNVLCDPGQSIMQCTGSGWGFLSGAGASCTPMNVAGVACR